MSEPAFFRPVVDDASDYREAIRRAEQEAGLAPDGTELAAGETPDVTPELPEAVPVQASDQPFEAEPETPVEDTSEIEQETSAAPETLTTEQLQAKLAEAEARLAEKDSFIGRQSGEVGELRRTVDELSARVDAAAQQPITPQVPQAPVTQADIDNDPEEATVRAFRQKDEHALERAFEAWRYEDPFVAATWLNDRKLAQQQEAFDAKLAAYDEKIQTVAAPVAQNAEQAKWNAAFVEVQKTRPDFIQNAERLLDEVAPKFPAVVTALANGDVGQRAEMLAVLYDLDKLGNPEQVRQDLEREAQEAAAEAAASRAAAGVVTGQTTVGQSTVEKTDEELEQEAYISRMDNKPSLSRGWTGRS